MTKEQQALECANHTTKIDIDCPREALNPGLYFGFIKGWDAAVNELRATMTVSHFVDEYNSVVEENKKLKNELFLNEG